MKIYKWVNHRRYSIAENEQGVPVGVLIRLDDESYQKNIKTLKSPYISAKGVMQKQSKKEEMKEKVV